MTGEQIGNVDLVKQLNSAVVYRLIDQQGPISRIQIADISQLAPASVTKITRQLMECGLIKEVAQQASTGGRRAISLTTEVEPFHSVAVRLGRDYIQLSLLNLNGVELAKSQSRFVYTSQPELESGIIKHIRQFLKAQTNKVERLIAIGIVLPGLIDSEKGIAEYIPDVNVNKFTLSDIVKNAFHVECFIGNDIRGTALAEYYFGASQDCKDSILVSVHRGVGAGIIVNGQVFLGFNRNVGEIGHIQVDPLGNKCQCGNFGCLETFVSNPAVLKRIRSLISQGYPSSLATVNEITMTEVCQHALKGDELAKQSLIDVGNRLGQAIAITVNLFNPQKIVIAGDITQAEELLFPAIRRNIETQSLTRFHSNLPIVVSELENRPTLGAFAMIKRAMLNGVLLQKLLGE